VQVVARVHAFACLASVRPVGSWITHAALAWVVVKIGSSTLQLHCCSSVQGEEETIASCNKQHLVHHNRWLHHQLLLLLLVMGRRRQVDNVRPPTHPPIHPYPGSCTHARTWAASTGFTRRQGQAPGRQRQETVKG
jgi:hypothetical protein